MSYFEDAEAEDLEFDQMISDMIACSVYKYSKAGKELVDHYNNIHQAYNVATRLQELTDMYAEAIGWQDFEAEYGKVVYKSEPTYTPKELEKNYGRMYTEYVENEEE